MQFTSKNIHQSNRFPGVAFAIAVLSEGRRITLALSLADIYDEIESRKRAARGIAEKAKAQLAAVDATDTAAVEKLNQHPDILAAAEEFTKVEQLKRNKLYPAYVRELFVEVTGLDIDGVPATPETTIAVGPLELYEEILQKVLVELGLAEDEEKN